MSVSKTILGELKDLTQINDVEKHIKDSSNPQHGDLSLMTFDLAKQEKRPPHEIAQEIASKISLTKSSFFSQVEPVGGYVNFFYNFKKIADIVLPVVDGSYGKSNIGEGTRVMIEHTSVNPNKALHIGHARNCCLGDSLGRILRFAGYDVQIANYIDDTGSQVADTIVGLKFLGFPLEKPGVKFDHYAGDEVYVQVNRKYEEEPTLQERRSFVLSQIEKGDNEIARFAEEFVEKVLRHQLQTLWRMGIFYDLLNHESHILKYKFWDIAFENMKKGGYLVYEESGRNSGCWVLKSERLPDWLRQKHGEMENPDKILVRSDGTVVYAGKDIAYAMWKHGLLGQDFRYSKFVTQPNNATLWTTTVEDGKSEHPSFGNVDKSINVIDLRQSYEQDVVKAGLELIAGGRKEYTHFAYEIVSLTKETVEQLNVPNISQTRTEIGMSGRRGIFINTDNVLDTLARKAYQESKNRNPNIDEDSLRKISDSIAVAALRYELTKFDPSTKIIFDMNKALQLQGDTGPYLQYTYARAHNLLEKVGDWHYESVPVDTAYEKQLIKSLIAFPDVVEIAATQLKPSAVARYSNVLATAFNNFYEKCPVLRADNTSVKNSRAALAKATMHTLENSLYLIGIPTLNRM